METAFLSNEDDQQLAVVFFSDSGMSVIELSEFLKESLIGMSRSQRLKYHIALKDFCEKLMREDI